MWEYPIRTDSLGAVYIPVTEGWWGVSVTSWLQRMEGSDEDC